MTGPFYGSLAASASVFVAILTALLVNNYVQIKSDKRQTKKELARVAEELAGLENQRDDHRETVERLTSLREDRYREIAEERVEEFIENQVPEEISKPIEKLDITELYDELLKYYDRESPADLEESTEQRHHREVLAEKMRLIEDEVLLDNVFSFADQYRGRGYEHDDDEFEELVEKARRKEDERGDDLEYSNEVESVDDDIDIKVSAEELVQEPLSLEDFIQKYKQEYSLNELDQETRELLAYQYDELVDQNPLENLSSTLDVLMGKTSGASALFSPGQIDIFPSSDHSPAPSENVAGLNAQEQRVLDEAEKNLREVKNQIDTLERTQNRLQRQLEGLNPEDLKTTLGANVATIMLSVVVPMAAYLDTLTNFSASRLSFVNIWWIGSSWLIGLLIVFGAIYLKIIAER